MAGKLEVQSPKGSERLVPREALRSPTSYRLWPAAVPRCMAWLLQLVLFSGEFSPKRPYLAGCCAPSIRGQAKLFLGAGSFEDQIK